MRKIKKIKCLDKCRKVCIFPVFVFLFSDGVYSCIHIISFSSSQPVEIDLFSERIASEYDLLCFAFLWLCLFFVLCFLSSLRLHKLSIIRKNISLTDKFELFVCQVFFYEVEVRRRYSIRRWHDKLVVFEIVDHNIKYYK